MRHGEGGSVKNPNHPTAAIESLALLTKHQVAAALGVSTRSVDRMSASGELPSPIRIGRRLVRYRSSEIQNFISRSQQENSHHD